MRTAHSKSFPDLLQRFFLERLLEHKKVSPCTVAAYRDSFRLLLNFAHHKLGKAPASLTLSDLSVPLILAFLKHIEDERGNSIRSRNARFAAIRSFMEYVSFEEPAALAHAQSVLAIPMKRFEQPMIGFLSREHIEAILAAPDQNSWSGQRDRVMLLTLYNTGARVSELTSMRVDDLVLDTTAWIRIRGKGRKERSVPIWSDTAAALKRWLHAYPRDGVQPLFPNRFGNPLTRVGVTERLKLAVKLASRNVPDLAKCRVFPHLLRHSIAMHLLQSGVDITVIALWLGHESPVTTHRYVEADIAMKDKALKAIQPASHLPLRYRPKDQVLQFLQSL